MLTRLIFTVVIVVTFFLVFSAQMFEKRSFTKSLGFQEKVYQTHREEGMEGCPTEPEINLDYRRFK